MGMWLPITSAVAVMVLRLVQHHSGRTPEGTDLMLVHFLAIVTIVFIADIRLLRREPHTSFPGLVRQGFRDAAVYAVLTAALVWYFYAHVDPAHFPDRIDAMVRRGMDEGQPEAVIRPRLERFFTPFNYATITFFALLAVSGLQALLIGALHHKLLRRAPG